MAHTRKTLALNNSWDIGLDSTGRIQLSHGDYATAQNVANECRLFTNDAFFDADRGIPYFAIALGNTPRPSVLASRLREAALLVEDVARIRQVSIEDINAETREITGTIAFTTQGGQDYELDI